MAHSSVRLFVRPLQRVLPALVGISLFATAYCPMLNQVGPYLPVALKGAIPDVASNTPEPPVSRIDAIKEDLLLNQDLIHFAGHSSYADSDRSDQVSMLSDWLQENLPTRMSTLNPRDQHDLIVVLQDSLDNMLAERDFGPEDGD